MGNLINTPLIQTEQAGLGDVGANWSDLRIMVRGPSIQLAGDKSRAVVPFKIPWYRRFELCARLIGWPFVPDVTETQFTQFARNLPESYRSWEYAIIRQGLDDPLTATPIPTMYCTQILDVKGFGDGAQDALLPEGGDAYYPEPTYKWAEVTALFETLMYDVKLLTQITDTENKPTERQRYVIKTEESGGRFLQFQIGQWKLRYDTGSGGVPPLIGNDPVGSGVYSTERLARQVNLIEPFKTIRYEWLDVLPQALNMPRADSMLGSTNKFIFDDYQPGTLLLQKFDRRPSMTQLGIRTYRVCIEMQFLPSGVNRAKPPSPEQQKLAEATGGYWDIVDYATETMQPYAATQFAYLFRP